MVLMLVHCLLLLLWFVQGHCSSDNDWNAEDAEDEWEKLSAVVNNEDASRNGYFYGRSSPIGQVYNPPASQAVLKAETHKELFKPENLTKPLPLVIKNMLLQAAEPPPIIAPVRKLIEVLCHIDRMFVRIRREIFMQDVKKDLRYGKCNVSTSNEEYYYFLYMLDDDCGNQKEVCTALSF